MEQNQEIVEIEVDEDVQKQVDELIRPYGITIEEFLAAFFHWCAEKPGEATAYLKAAVKVQIETQANGSGNG